MCLTPVSNSLLSLSLSSLTLFKSIVVPGEGDWDGCAHNHDEPGEDQIGQRQAVPNRVVEEPVAATAIVLRAHISLILLCKTKRREADSNRQDGKQTHNTQEHRRANEIKPYHEYHDGEREPSHAVQRSKAVAELLRLGLGSRTLASRHLQSGHVARGTTGVVKHGLQRVSINIEWTRQREREGERESVRERERERVGEREREREWERERERETMAGLRS
jgi:hypothetical protein